MPPRYSRRNVLVVAAALLAGSLSACGGGASEDSSTTLLVYLLGSNLEGDNSQATLNLREMLAAQGAKHTHVVITTGGADKAVAGDPVANWRTVKRHELVDGKLVELADLGPLDMDRGATLQDFLIWGAKTYPADRTLLVLWDHGGGYRGYGGDSNFADAGLMSLPEMGAALQGFKAATGVTLDYVGFDACLMATLEVAKVLAPCARYLGASQELEPGSGWDWRVVIDALSGNSGISMPVFGEIAAKGYVAKQLRESGQGSVIQDADWITFSITDLSRVPTLLARLADWADAVRGYYDDASLAKRGAAPLFWPPLLGAPRLALKDSGAADAQDDPTDASVQRWVRVAMSRLRASSFGLLPEDKDELDLVDLRHFSSLLAAEGIAVGANKALQQAIDEAVVFKVNGQRAAQAGGLSIYFPMGAGTQEQRELYAPLAMPDGYVRLLERHAAQAAQAPSVITVSPPAPMAQPHLLSSEIASLYGVQFADLMLVQPRDAASAMVRGSAPLITAVGTDMSPGEHHQGLAVFDTERWPLLGGEPLMLYTLSNQTNEEGVAQAVVLGAPVRLSRANGGAPELVVLLLRCMTVGTVDDMRIEGRIIGAQNIDFSKPDAPPDRVDRDIGVGDVLEPVHLLIDLASGEPVQQAGQMIVEYGAAIRLTADSALRQQPLVGGAWTLCMAVTDLADGVKLSAPAAYIKA